MCGGGAAKSRNSHLGGVVTVLMEFAGMVTGSDTSCRAVAAKHQRAAVS